MLNLTGIQEVAFDEKDLQIFNIPDTKTKLSVLQNYFFPRLEILLRYTLPAFLTKSAIANNESLTEKGFDSSEHQTSNPTVC